MTLSKSLSALIVACGLTVAGAANAAPVAPDAALSGSVNPMISEVRDGCGPGAIRTRYGRCAVATGVGFRRKYGVSPRTYIRRGYGYRRPGFYGRGY